MTSAKPRDKTTSEENKQFDPGGKGEKAPLWNADLILFFFWGERWGVGCPLLVLRDFLFCVPVCLLFIYCSFQVIIFSELKNMRGDADQVADVRNRRTSIFLPINPRRSSLLYPVRCITCLRNRVVRSVTRYLRD